MLCKRSIVSLCYRIFYISGIFCIFIYHLKSEFLRVSKHVISLQLFRQRLSHIGSVKAYVTMQIGVMGIKSLAMLD